jgi:uncharacterized membrane protein
MFLGITPVSSVSNGLYFLTLPLVSVTLVIYTSKGMSKKFGVRVIHEVRVIHKKNTVILALFMYVCIVIPYLDGRHGVAGHMRHIYRVFCRYFDPVPLLKEIYSIIQKNRLYEQCNSLFSKTAVSATQ